MASRYCFFAMKISPRNSGVIAGWSGAAVCGREDAGVFPASTMELPACASKQPPVTTAATTTERGREIIIAPFASFKHIQQSAEKARLLFSLLSILGGCLLRLRRRGLGALRRGRDRKNVVQGKRGDLGG